MQSLGAETQPRAVVRIGEEEKSYGEGVVAGLDQVTQGREPACALGHLLTCRVGEMLGMQPHWWKRLVVRGLRLRDLVFMMREHQVNAPGVDVERVAEISLAHRGALDMPAWPAAAEGRVPRSTHLLITRLRLLPESEVAHRLLVVFVSRHARARLETGAIEVRQGAVGRKACDTEVPVAVGDVRVAGLEEGLDHRAHIGNVLGRTRIMLGPLRPK